MTVVRTERVGHVLVARIEREEKRNAINEEITLGIDAALNTLDDDSDLWVGILTGTAKVFSAGTDLTGTMPTSARGGEYGIIRRERAKPLIAAVEGFAVGGGFEIVLACDLVVASRTATFGLPEVKRGLIPTCGGLFRGPRALPLNLAREMMLTGDSIDAARGYDVGLVNAVTEPGGALAGALALAERICACGPNVVRISMSAVNDVIAADDAEDWDATARATHAMVTAPDKDEGMRAFFEKRPPNWELVQG
jgi:enoyl-CoA hydratase/carnithine racemase